MDFNLVLVDGDLFHVLEEGIFLEILMFKLVFGRITVYYMYKLCIPIEGCYGIFIEEKVINILNDFSSSLFHVYISN